MQRSCSDSPAGARPSHLRCTARDNGIEDAFDCSVWNFCSIPDRVRCRHGDRTMHRLTQRARPRTFQALRALIAGARRATCRGGWRRSQPMRSTIPTRSPSAPPPASPPAPSVQPSTLVRFAQALGYQGFSDLQDVFRSRLRDRVPSYDERLAQMREHGIAASKAGLLLDGFAGGRRAARSPTSASKRRPRGDRAGRGRARRRPRPSTSSACAGPSRSRPTWAMRMGKLGVRNILVDGVAGHGRRAGELHHAGATRAGDQLHALCQRDGGADQGGQGRAAPRSSRITDSAVLADRPAGRCADRGRRGRISRASARMAATMALAMTLRRARWPERRSETAQALRSQTAGGSAANCPCRAPAGRNR